MTKGNPINFVVQGDGPPVILIHGMAASHYDWDFLTPQLVRYGYRAYALDLLGHGDSAKPQEARDYHYDSLYRHLVEWIAELQLDQPPVLISHSLGGYLSLAYAVDNPLKVRGLVLVDPFYHPDQLPPLIRLFNRQPALGEKAWQLTPGWMIDVLLSWDSLFSERLSPNVRKQIAVDYKRASPKILYLTHTIPELTSSLSSITAPALVVWGHKDLTLDPKSFPPLVQSLPNSRGFPVPDCGHQPHLSKPDVFNQLVLDFLSHLTDEIPLDLSNTQSVS